MKSKRKALTLAVCAVLLVVTTALGTLAYLTDSESVTNTFTVGQVAITLDEKDVDDSTPDKERDTANEYHLLPGLTYDKDPTIHVSDDSEDCYLFVKVENGIADIEGGTKIADQMKKLGWKAVEGYTNLYVFAKEEKLDKYALLKGADVVVFENFTIDGDSVDNTKLAEYADKTVVVTAYAVQKAGFEETAPADIWKATFGASVVQ